MEKLLNPCDKEYMRMAMLKHEETFREQVYELHRLYEIQKMLMKNIETSRRNGQHTKKKTTLNMHKGPRQNLDLERPAEEYINLGLAGDGVLEIEDEREIELTLGPSSYYRRRKAAAETLLNSDSGPSFSSSSTGSTHMKGTEFARDKSTSGRKWKIMNGDVPHDSKPSFLSGRRNNSVDVEEEQQLRQDRLNQTPWLFQVLSLNIT